METVAFCEREEFPQRVLQKNFPGVPIYEDVCTLTKERLDQDGIDTRTIDLISAGYPCQPFSHTGKREGENDDRYLWGEVARILQEIRPDWFIGENVIGHISMGIDKVLNDLEKLSYTYETFDIPACAVNAEHERRRVFIVAHAIGKRSQGRTNKGVSNKSWEKAQQQFERLLQTNTRLEISTADFTRANDGVSRRMDEDRVKALGNAVVPQQIYPILAAIKAVYRSVSL